MGKKCSDLRTLVMSFYRKLRKLTTNLNNSAWEEFSSNLKERIIYFHNQNKMASFVFSSSYSCVCLAFVVVPLLILVFVFLLRYAMSLIDKKMSLPMEMPKVYRRYKYGVIGQVGVYRYTILEAFKVAPRFVYFIMSFRGNDPRKQDMDVA